MNTGVRRLYFRLGLQSQGQPWLYVTRVAMAVAWRTEGGLALEFSCMSESPKELLKSLASLLYPPGRSNQTDPGATQASITRDASWRFPRAAESEDLSIRRQAAACRA